MDVLALCFCFEKVFFFFFFARCFLSEVCSSVSIHTHLYGSFIMKRAECKVLCITYWASCTKSTLSSLVQSAFPNQSGVGNQKPILLPQESRVCVCVWSASNDFPFKTVNSIPFGLFNTFNEKCLFYIVQNHINIIFLNLCYFATALTFLSVYVQLMVSTSPSYWSINRKWAHFPVQWKVLGRAAD